MAVYSHTYELKAAGKVYKGKLQFKSGQAYSQVDESEHRSITTATDSDVSTLMTAISTFKTAKGEFQYLKVLPTSEADSGKKSWT